MPHPRKFTRLESTANALSHIRFGQADNQRNRLAGPRQAAARAEWRKRLKLLLDTGKDDK